MAEFRAKGQGAQARLGPQTPASFWGFLARFTAGFASKGIAARREPR